MAADNEILNRQLIEAKFKNAELADQLAAEKLVSEQNKHQLEYITSISSVALREASIGKLISRFINRTAEFSQCDWACYLPIAQHSLQLKNDYRYLKPTTHVQDLALIESQSEPLKQLNLTNININHIKSMIKQNEAETCILGDDFLIDAQIEFELVILFPIVFEKGIYGCVLFCHLTQNMSFNDQIVRVQTIETIRTLVADAIKRRLTEQTLHNRVTELHKTNKALNETQKQLLRSERMASIGQLAAGVAHEINNPIGYVASNLDTLSEYLDLFTSLANQVPSLKDNLANNADALQQQIEQIYQVSIEEEFGYITKDSHDLLQETKKGLTRVKEIVAGLKTFSHMDEDTFTHFDLSEVISQALAVCWNQLKYKVEVIQHIAPDLFIKGNKGQIEQVLVNLFINALHAMGEEGGSLTIISYEHQDFIKLTVTDTGCGIEDSAINKMFDPFYTTKPVGLGTGLGLSISLNIIEKHQAKIDVKSKLNFGTCFTLTFPKAKLN
ncbi:sensor histidine kinase [Catenovulum maritimum]|nr:ATP-binding protein [Catenovulum maritimum]